MLILVNRKQKPTMVGFLIVGRKCEAYFWNCCRRLGNDKVHGKDLAIGEHLLPQIPVVLLHSTMIYVVIAVLFL